jgi:hypothetical protein
MNKLWKFLQYGYLLIALICLIDGIRKWNSDRNTAIILLVFSVFITLVFFLKRHFRKKVEKRNSQHK